jgi:hypothetical protein
MCGHDDELPLFRWCLFIIKQEGNSFAFVAAKNYGRKKLSRKGAKINTKTPRKLCDFTPWRLSVK